MGALVLQVFCANSKPCSTSRIVGPVVVVSTAHGLKFANSKAAYHEDSLQIGRAHV